VVLVDMVILRLRLGIGKRRRQVTGAAGGLVMPGAQAARGGGGLATTAATFARARRARLNRPVDVAGGGARGV